MKSRRCFRRMLPVAALAVFIHPSVQATPINWSGATNAWNLNTNWAGNTLPVSGDSLDFNTSGAGGLSLNNDLTSGSFNIAGINYGSSAVAFIIGNGTATANVGNQFALTGPITHNGSNAEIINNPISLAAVQTITPNGTITLGGVISGGGGITLAGASGKLLILSQANLYSDATTVTGGVLRLSNATALPGGIAETGGSSALTINGGVVELNSSNFLRDLGTGATQVQIPGGVSGFGAQTAARVLNFNNDAHVIQWGSATFAPSTLVLNETTSNNKLTLANAIDLNAATRTIAVNANTAEISGILSTSSGTAGLTKTGNGTLILSGANTYTGTTTISAGTLQVGNATSGSLNSGSNPIGFNGLGTFAIQALNGGSSLTLSAVDTSASDATIRSVWGGSGNAVLTLSGLGARPAGSTRNYALTNGTNGTTNKIEIDDATADSFIGQGTFFNGNNYAWYDTGGFVRGIAYTGTPDAGAATSGTTTSVASTTYQQVTGAITAQANASFTTLHISGASNFTLDASQTVTSNGILKTGNNAATVSGGTSLTSTTADAELVIRTDQSSDALTINTAILANGTNALTKTGAGTLTLGNTGNTYTGTTTVVGGTLVANVTGSLGAGTPSVTVQPGGIFTHNATMAANLALNGGTLKPSGGTLSGTITLAAGIMSNIDGSTIQQTGLVTGVTGTGGLKKINNTRANLGGTNNYTGTTLVTAGVLQFQEPNALYAGNTANWTPANLTVANGGTLSFKVGGATGFASSAISTLVTNLTTVNNNGFQAGSSLNLETAGIVTISANITDSTGAGGGKVGLWVSGASALTLSGSSTYSGRTLIASLQGNSATSLSVSSFNSVVTNPGLGTVHATSSNLGAPTTVSDGIIELGAGGNQQTITLTYTGAGETTDRVIRYIVNGSGSKNIKASGSGLLKFTSAFTGSGGNNNMGFGGTGLGEIVQSLPSNMTSGLTKSDAGTWTFAAANAYTGTTTISGGCMVLKDANSIPGGLATTGGTSAVNFNGGIIGLGASDFTRSLAAAGTVTAATFTGNGGWAAFGADRSVNLGGAGDPIDWATANTGLNGKTLILGHALATHMVTVQNPLNLSGATRTVQVDDGAAAIDGKLSGVLSGTAASLTKTGAGTLALTNTNNYDGATTVSAGTLALGASNVLPDTAVLIGNATLDAATFTDTLGTLVVTSTATINLGTGAALAFADSSAISWTGGTLNLTGTFVSGSSLRFGDGTGTGLTVTQLGLITAAGFSDFALNGSGYLTATSDSAYDAWATGLANPAFDFDSDNNGIPNGLQWILGGTQTQNDVSAIAPVESLDATDLILTFKRVDGVTAEATLTAEWDVDLAGIWTSVPINETVAGTYNYANGVTVTVVENGSDPDDITVKIPRANAVGGTLFARLKATMP